MADDGWKTRLRSAVDRIGGQAALSRLTGTPVRTLSRWLNAPGGARFTEVVSVAEACSESLDWIAWGTRPAIDEAELAKALLLIEQFCTTAQLSAADRARAVHLIYMRAMEAPGRPLSRAELLRLFSIPG